MPTELRTCEASDEELEVLVLVGLGFGVDFWLDDCSVEAAERGADGACTVPAPDLAAGFVAADFVAAGVGPEAADAVAPGEGAAASARLEIAAADDATGEEAADGDPPPDDDEPLPLTKTKTPIATTKPTTMIAAMLRWTAAMCRGPLFTRAPPPSRTDLSRPSRHAPRARPTVPLRVLSAARRVLRPHPRCPNRPRAVTQPPRAAWPS